MDNLTYSPFIFSTAMSTITLSCLIKGNRFSCTTKIKVDPSKDVDHLKELIKSKEYHIFEDFDISQLVLWKIDTSIDKFKENPDRAISNSTRKEMCSDDLVNEYFRSTPYSKHVHILIGISMLLCSFSDLTANCKIIYISRFIFQ